MSRSKYVQSFLGACSGLAYVAASVLIFPSHIAAQSALPAEDTANFSSLREWISLQEELREHLDRTFIELNAALAANDYDADSLSEFVRQKIAFQDYQGVVRGATGTLQTLAGNALDQSLLLATLLRDSGYDARIAHAKIGSDLANLLFGQMARFPSPPQVYGDGASEILFKIAEFLESQNSTPDSTAEEWETELEERRQLVGNLSTAIVKTLADNEVSLQQGIIPSELVEEVRDYYWCQYRDGPSSDWVNVHPAFDTTPAGFASLQPAMYFQGEIPEELLQRITFQLFASRRVGGRTEASEIMQSWSRPVANLYETPIVISLVPSQFVRIGEEDYDASSDLFLPYLNESLAPGAKAFDLNGNIVPADAALSNMAGVFRTVSDKGISAATALQHLGKSEEGAQKRAMALKDIWLEISLSGPGVDPDRRWRRSFRSDGGAGLPTGHSLARKIVINLAAGPPSPAKSYEQSLQVHIEALKLTINQQSTLKTDALQGRSDPGTAQYEVDHTILEGIGNFASYLELLEPNTENSVSYRHQPLIVAKHYSMFPDAEEPEGLDIVNNSRRSFVFGKDDQPEYAPRVSLDYGIAEAITEFAVLEWEYGFSINAVTEYHPVLAGATPQVFSNPGDTSVQTVESLRVRQLIQESLEEGRVVISPPPKEHSDDVKAWWELDPKTGEIIGRTRNGWGGSYFVLAMASEDLITRRIVIAVTCVMVVQKSCRLYSRTAVAAIAVGISGSGYLGCQAFFLVPPGSLLPPGTPNPCSRIKEGHTFVIRALRGVEDWLYKDCSKRALPACVKAAAAGG